MPGKKTIIQFLKERLPKYISTKSRTVEYGRECYEKNKTDWNFLASELWELGRLLLANNEIEEAKKCFTEGTILTLDENKMRVDIFPGIGADYETPLKAYLGDLTIGKLYSTMPQITLEELNDSNSIYQSWYYGLYGLIQWNDDYVRNICALITEKTRDFRLASDGMPPSVTPKRLSLSYAFYSIKMLQAVVEKDSDTFSRYMNYHSRLMEKALTRADNPMALVDLGLVVLYDNALGRGLNPSVDTPFIPEKILTNGYWYSPK
jgi:hypothetical protein